MIGFTYAQLLQAMQDWPENQGANYIGNIPRFVELGELRLVRDLDLEIFDVTDTLYLAAGQNTLAKPPELLQLRTMRYGNVLDFVAGDPSFSDVVMLLHMDGTSGSSAFVDSSGYGYAMTSSGAAITALNAYFGSGAANFTATNQYIQSPSFAINAPQDLSQGDFTVECWINPMALANGYFLGVGTIANSDGIYLEALSNGTITATLYTGAGTQTLNSNTVTYAANAWAHVAFVSYNGAGSLYINGIFVGTAMNSQFPISMAGSVWVGNSSSGGTGFVGLVDELRITAGLARYTANFTPPSGPFPGSSAPIITTGMKAPTYKRAFDYLRNFGNNPAVTGPPRYYAEQDSNTWLLSAYADQNYGIVVRYLMRPLSVVVLGSSWLADRCGDLLLLTSLMEAEHYLKGDDRFGDLEQDYKMKLQIAKAELRNSTRQGDYSPVKSAAMPA
jgi:hypothetical protein